MDKKENKSEVKRLVAGEAREIRARSDRTL